MTILASGLLFEAILYVG